MITSVNIFFIVFLFGVLFRKLLLNLRVVNTSNIFLEHFYSFISFESLMILELISVEDVKIYFI